MKELLKRHIAFIISLGILLILLLHNPYSQRNLIANLEPFPDAMYYTTVPRCFLEGQGWKMCRLHDPELPGVKAAVPPAYSISLLPAYVLNSDVRSFYFINILLSVFSLFLFYKVSKNFFKNGFITGLLLFFYVTNYFVYWYPTLAMAENLLIPIFLLSVLVLQQKKLTLNISFISGIIAAGFYGTKYAFAPLTITFPIIYTLKVWYSDFELKEKVKHLFSAGIPGTFLLVNLVGIEKVTSVFNQITNGAFSKTKEGTNSAGGFFSISYFPWQSKAYANSLLGKPERFLWDRTPLTERWIALPALLGLFSTFIKNRSWAKVWLTTAVVAQFLFISTFYVVDIRYVYHFLPILLFGFGFLLEIILEKVLRVKLYKIVFILLLLTIYLSSNLIRLKKVTMTNLKYSETPWNYLAQIELNNYFTNFQNISEKKPILITLDAPFFNDNYSNLSYFTLPLDSQQDFKGNFKEIWGDNDYSDLIELYTAKIQNDYDVYLTNYRINAADRFQDSFDEINNNFNLIQVHSGCYDLCNIYKLELPESISE